MVNKDFRAFLLIIFIIEYRNIYNIENKYIMI